MSALLLMMSVDGARDFKKVEDHCSHNVEYFLLKIVIVSFQSYKSIYTDVDIIHVHSRVID